MVTLKHTGVGQLNGEAATILPDEDRTSGRQAAIMLSRTRNIFPVAFATERSESGRRAARGCVLSMLYDEILDDLVGFMTRRIAHNNLKAVPRARGRSRRQRSRARQE